MFLLEIGANKMFSAAAAAAANDDDDDDDGGGGGGGGGCNYVRLTIEALRA